MPNAYSLSIQFVRLFVCLSEILQHCLLCALLFRLSVAEMCSTCQHIVHSIIADRQTDRLSDTSGDDKRRSSGPPSWTRGYLIIIILRSCLAVIVRVQALGLSHISITAARCVAWREK